MDVPGSKHHVEVKIVTVDVADLESRTGAFSQIEVMTRDLDLGVLSRPSYHVGYCTN